MIRIKINKMSEAYDNKEASNNYNPNELQDMRLPDESPHDQLPQAWALHMPNGEPQSHDQTSHLTSATNEEYELDEDLLYEKKDRCYRLAKQKYDVFPSAYASGFIVRCRQGKVGRKKKANEKLEIDEEWSDKYKRSIDCDNPEGFSQRAHCQGRKKNESLNLDDVLDSIDSLLEGTFDKEKSQGLHGWFSRAGGKGSSGWVDCNTCRTNPKTGRKTCKTCGRQSGEERSKYPACRPTPSACTKRGTSSKRGPMRVSWKKKKKEE